MKAEEEVKERQDGGSTQSDASARWVLQGAEDQARKEKVAHDNKGHQMGNALRRIFSPFTGINRPRK